jgi:hypothetical protein
MKFTLEIELEDDAMQTGTDVIKSIRESLKGEESLPLDEGTAGILWDVNGNIVGSWKVSEDIPAQPTPDVVPVSPAETPHPFDDKDIVGFCSVCGMRRYDPKVNHAE